VLGIVQLTDVNVSLLVIYNYDGHSQHDLRLSVGDTVQIKERFTGNSVSHVCGNYGHFGPKTLWTLLDPGHFSTSLVGPNCLDRLALVLKCPKESLALSAKLSCAKCRTVLLQVRKSLALFLITVVCSCSIIKNAVCIDSGVSSNEQ